MERFGGWITVLQFGDCSGMDSWDCWGCRDTRRRRVNRNRYISCFWSIWSVLLAGLANQPENQIDQTNQDKPAQRLASRSWNAQKETIWRP